VAPVSRLVDPVAGEPAGQHARYGLPAEAVRDEIVRAVRHRHDHALPEAGPCPLDERREDLHRRAERPGGEVGNLDRRQTRRRVFEHTRPAEVVQVVPCPQSVLRMVSEPRDGAVDGRRRGVIRADAEPRRDAWAEPLDHDVRSCA
jgi:hypothetical protein